MIVTEKISIEDYQQLEKDSGERYEYIGGEVRRMAGTTLEHEIIVKRLIRLLDVCLEEKGCTLVTGQMKLYTPHYDKAFLYPDIHIYCGEIKKQKMPQGAYALINPSFIIEVLSKENRNYDPVSTAGGDKPACRSGRFDCYRQISSLQGYALIESDLEGHEPAIYVRTREGKQAFKEQTLASQDTLDVLGCLVECETIYSSIGRIG